jgi:enamine deaminase RidA (YjgF/YER057c/UK114 family)
MQMTRRVEISTGSEFERIFGYSRAVVSGPGRWVSVAGCTAATLDGAVGTADVAAQTGECLRRVEQALHEAGASVADVVRTRLFVTDIRTWRDVGAVHAAFFGDVRPASTIVEVRALVLPEIVVEIEADAVIHDDET